MEINEIPRGQLSTIILTALLDGDKYGYEIIQTVEEKTQGELIIKKPSLYSSLTRMENQELVSSYWKESDIGGRRHYYRLTDFGRKQVLQWQEDLKKAQTKVSKVIQEKVEKEKPIILQQENLFSLHKENNLIENKPSQIKSEEKKTEDFIQYDLFSSDNFVATPEKTTPQPTVVFNANMFNQDFKKDNDIKNNDYNPTCPIFEKTNTVKDDEFNIENELSSYVKHSKSYADVVKSQEIKQAHNDLLNLSNDFHFGNQSEFIDDNLNTFTPEDNETNVEDVETIAADNKSINNDYIETSEDHLIKDDAVFITETPSEDEMPKVRKIEPASFAHLDISPTITKTSHSQTIINNQSTISSHSYFENYDDLKRYYAKDNITLKTYNPYPSKTNSLNCNEIYINKFNFLQTLIFSLLVFIDSALFFVGLKLNNLISMKYIYVYIITTVLFTIPTIYNIIKLKQNKYKKINITNIKQKPFIVKCILILLTSGILFAFNLLCGMTLENWSSYITTTLFPFAILINYLVIHIFKLVYVSKLKLKNK